MKSNNITPTLTGGSSSDKKFEPQSLSNIEEYLRCLAQIRVENNISVEDVMQHLNYSRSTLDALENGNSKFIQYPPKLLFYKAICLLS